MKILGVTEQQSLILRRLEAGESYQDISKDLGLSFGEIVREEMIALSILSGRWKKSERDVKLIIKAMLAIVLSLLPMVELTHFDRAVRSKTTSSRAARTRRQESLEDLALLDV